MNNQSDREYENYRSDESDSKFKSERKLQTSQQNYQSQKKVLCRRKTRMAPFSQETLLMIMREKFKNYVRELKF
jgi:hypothetical protein